MDFFCVTEHRGSQGGTSTPCIASTGNLTAGREVGLSLRISITSTVSLATGSPTGSSNHAVADMLNSKERVTNSSYVNARELIDPTDDFSTSKQPILDTTLKEMLIFLYSSSDKDMISVFP